MTLHATGTLSAFLVSLHVLTQGADIPQSHNDLWEGAIITATSPVRPGFDPNAVFGANVSPTEPGSLLFADGYPDGFVHFIEWKTAAPVRLGLFHLFAAGDGQIYSNEREFGQFVLKAKLHAT